MHVNIAYVIVSYTVLARSPSYIVRIRHNLGSDILVLVLHYITHSGSDGEL